VLTLYPILGMATCTVRKNIRESGSEHFDPEIYNGGNDGSMRSIAFDLRRKVCITANNYRTIQHNWSIFCF